MKKTVKILVISWIIFLILVIAVNLFNRSIKIEMVQHGEMEKSYSFDAMVIRDETVIKPKKNGVLESMVSDNEMVKKNKHIASIYETEVDGTTKSKLASINMRIEEIAKVREDSANVVSTGFIIESAMDDKVLELTRAMEEGDVQNAISAKTEINLLNDKKNVWKKGKEYTDEVLDSLVKEKKEYERRLGNAKEDLYSPASGIYSTNIDGYEEILTSDAIGTMTYDDYTSIKEMDITREEARKKGYPCKIIDNFTWSVAFIAKEDEVSKLKTGSSVYVRNSGSSQDMYAKVSYISPPERGKYVVVVTSDVSCDWAMKDRFVKISLIKSKYSGLKIPVEALRVKDGKTGVYVVVDGIVKFKNAKVLYKDSGYAIIEENNISQGGLLLYDEVIVSSSRKLNEGDKIS